MTESARSQPAEPDTLERAVDEAIAVCDGDVRAALRAALVYNDFLERKLDRMRGMVSSGYARGSIRPTRKASETVEHWREIFHPSKTEDSTKSTDEAGAGMTSPAPD